MSLLTPREFFALANAVAHAVEPLPASGQHDVDRNLDEMYSAYLAALRENERLSQQSAEGQLWRRLQEPSLS